MHIYQIFLTIFPQNATRFLALHAFRMYFTLCTKMQQGFAYLSNVAQIFHENATRHLALHIYQIFLTIFLLNVFRMFFTLCTKMQQRFCIFIKFSHIFPQNLSSFLTFCLKVQQGLHIYRCCSNFARKCNKALA